MPACTRFHLFAAAFALMLPLGAEAGERTVYKSATCTCCSKWMSHMAENGYKLEPKDVDSGQLNRLKATLGVKREHASCHTALIDGYVIEGHVPAADVTRLLAEKPDAIGLSVAGMPAGSPGMEVGDTMEPFAVLLLKKDGTTEEFSRHGPDAP